MADHDLVIDLSDKELDLLGPLIIPNFDLGNDITNIGSDSDQGQDEVIDEEQISAELGPLVVQEHVADDDISDLNEDIVLDIVAEPEADQDLMEMMDVVENQQNHENAHVHVSESSRFPKLNDLEKENILEETHCKTTKKQTKYGIKIFRQWLTERGKDLNFEDYTEQILDSTLSEFYTEVRNTEGNYYARSTFVGIHVRASINRHLRSPPHNKTYSILSNDPQFAKSNKMFVAMLKKIQREGMDNTKHHPPISEGDLEKLRKSDALSLNTPKTLQRKVWFDLVLSFGRRGRENQRSFTNKTFVIKVDDRGSRYVEMAVSETTKNHKGGLDDNQNAIKPRMYETKKPGCPVSAFEMYLSKRNPTTDFFFQQPRNKINLSDEMWYTSRPVGEKILNNMMVEISKSAELSMVYTNHCVRATTVTVLAQAVVAKTDIMKITGHKSEASLESYYRDSSDKQKRQYSAILQGNTEPIVQDHMPVVQQLPTTVPRPVVTPMLPNLPSSHCQLNVNNTNINNQVALPALYNKQFEVHNSTIQVFNYNITGNSTVPQ